MFAWECLCLSNISYSIVGWPFSHFFHTIKIPCYFLLTCNITANYSMVSKESPFRSVAVACSFFPVPFSFLMYLVICVYECRSQRIILKSQIFPFTPWDLRLTLCHHTWGKATITHWARHFLEALSLRAYPLLPTFGTWLYIMGSVGWLWVVTFDPF